MNQMYQIYIYTVSEASNSVKHWHLDDECKQIINECVEGLVSQHAPRQVSNGLQLVVDEQLWRHCYEPCNVILFIFTLQVTNCDSH